MKLDIIREKLDKLKSDNFYKLYRKEIKLWEMQTGRKNPGEGTRLKIKKKCLKKVDKKIFNLLFPIKKGGRYNSESIKWINIISKDLNIHIQHAENGGEKPFIIDGRVKYYVDGYMKIGNIKVALEIDEKRHKYNLKNDFIRQQEIEKNYDDVFFIRMDYYTDDLLMQNEISRVINKLKKLKKN